MRDSRGRRTTVEAALQERQQQRQRGSGTRQDPMTAPVINPNPIGIDTGRHIDWSTQYLVNPEIWTDITRTGLASRVFTAAPNTNIQRRRPATFTVNPTDQVTFQPDDLWNTFETVNRHVEETARIRTPIAPQAGVRRVEDNRAILPRGRVARTSTLRMNKTKVNYLTVMVCGRAYKGISYSYTPDDSRKIGTWKIGDIAVAEIDLTTVSLVKIMLPVGSDKILNHARFLWRLIGLNALRYKDKTIVKIPNSERSIRLRPGEVWRPETPILSYVEHSIRQSEQLELF